MQGIKKYEFRRQIAKKNVDEILVYSTFPQMKVIGAVKVEGVISETPVNLWNKTKELAGICKEKYFNYFSNRDIAHAYVLGNVKTFSPPRDLSDYGLKTAPQSFVYL
ncbi:MAG: hypothetical protein J6I73_08370 [Treponema sp.]|nr:hypothetical protein [Treponema sp.]